MIKGNGLSSGVCVGKVLTIKPVERNISDEKIIDVVGEVAKLDMYLHDIINETVLLTNKLSGNEKEIMNAHLMILQDPTLVDEARRLINEEKYNVLYAIDKGIDSVIKMFEAIDDPYLKERSRDIFDIKNRLLDNALGAQKVRLDKLEKNTVIVTYELTTSDTAQLDFENVCGIITEVGGVTSHSSIMARTHDIPAISGISDIYNSIKDKSRIAMNGDTGEIFINPKPDVLMTISKLKKDFDKNKRGNNKFRGKETVTKDGVKFNLFANIGNISDCNTAISNDCEGVGLFRSEFLYMDSDHLPNEMEQFEAYKSVVEVMGDKEVIIRTLDIGGDKSLSYLPQEAEANPFLGCRAIRLCFANLPVFKTQLRAILRASGFGNLAIMFPMISSLGQFRDAKKVLKDCMKELDSEGIAYNKNIKVGIMIEIPAAALNAKHFAKEADFFSIGTNDLIQYTVACERGNERIANLYTKFNPGVISLIKMSIDACHEEKIPCGMCGEACSDKLFIPLLVGMGLDEFSMSSNSILGARRLISTLDKSECEKLVNEILELGQAREIEEKLKKFIK